MRDGRGRFVSITLSILLAMCMLQPAVLAADFSNFRDNTDFLQGYYGEEQDHTLNVYASSIESEPAGQDQFEAALEGTELPILSIASAQGQPTTYYCLADVSGSLNQEQLTQEKDVLFALADSLSEDDRMVIATVGNEMAASEYLNDKDQLAQIIEGISITPDDTNLYTAIAESIRALDRSGNATQRKCMVILSDGKDYQQAGQTKADADRAIQETRIPVYTVALMRQSQANSNTWVEYAKLLGSLARESVGGAHFNPTLDGTDGRSAGEQIAADMRSDLVLTLDINSYVAEKEELKLLVQYSTHTGEVYGDTMTVYRQNLPLPTESLPVLTLHLSDAAGAVPEEGTVIRLIARDGQEYSGTVGPNGTVVIELPEGEYGLEVEGYSISENATVSVSSGENSINIQAERIEEEEPGGNWLWIVIATAILLVLCAVLFVIIREKKRKALQEAAEKEQTAVDGEAEESRDIAAGTETEKEAPLPSPSVLEERPLIPRVRVLFTAIGYEQVRFQLEIEKDRELTIGRDGRADLILNPNDKKLSGINSRIICSDHSMKVWDAGSMNGTAVNGVPLRGNAGAIIKDGQTLRVGDYEYRVQFITGDNKI